MDQAEIDKLVATSSGSQCYDLWKAETDTIDVVNKALARYAELVFAEYTRVRGCNAEAAAGVVKDRLKFFGEAGQEHLNRLVMKRVF